MNAYLLKIGDDLAVSNHDAEITFDGTTYEANGIIIEIGPTQAQAQFPSHSFRVRCDQGSDAYNLFDEKTGPIPSVLTYVEQQANLSWQSRWSFEGVLGGGGMDQGAYSSTLRHQLEYLFQVAPVLYWNPVSQKERENNNTDESLDSLPYIQRVLQDASVWKGTQ